MQVRGLVYDCDGVLFESRRANLAYYNAILQAFGHEPVTEDQQELARLCHTADSATVLRRLLGPGLAERALEMASRLDYRQFIGFMSPEPGMVDTLRTLARRLPLAVATNRGGSMPAILCHFELESCFSAVVTSRDVQRPKPAPDMLLLAAERLDVAPHSLLFVGDSHLDRQAAEAAGMPFVAYGGEVTGDWTVNSHRELRELVDRVSADA
ncbi:HAD superfamily hydrolase (TIGR01509 family)/HAD superfamily hydrolase (TIGR01549 family) [Geothermobacter ehrlichii]|uniref:phosphoglycolate phosphatase n=1 Tax=Geothermobacter ehrlichii TaxID=213224 RepID=A0A5D3WML1_9BACT|nr:HAD family hydrolase [Geothermobacter ehrlichii]TYO99576.1 HAD superfamily hydrolase (TIGR01509 family)/HAD superfamily hydrolase (TIGR01549 family) [Geothermobacter ehrlichii]